MIHEFLQIIQEGRKEDFKSKFRTKFSEEVLDRIISLVKPKYLDWVGRTIDGTNFERNFLTLTEYLNRFNEISSNLSKTDIYQYKSLGELVDDIKKYDSRNRRSPEILKDTNLVYDDGRYFVVNPLSSKASCQYGKGTKWCTASENPEQFNKYNDDGKIFYIIDRRLKQGDPLYKIALLKKFEGDEMFFDAQDRQFSKGWILSTDEYAKISQAINSYFENEFKEKIQIFKDKELKRKELQRLESLRQRRRYHQFEAEAQSRRDDQDWSLSNPEIEEIGLKANALVKSLELNLEIDILSFAESARISELNNILEILYERKASMENEGVDTDEIDTEIESSQEELDELNEKVDVYIAIPTGEHYDGTEFELLEPLNGRRYAVFTENEIKSSCETRVEELIDDIGYEGFNKSFARSHIDEDQVADEAEQIYNDDVWGNPDSYLDDSQRELSSKQEKLIQSYQLKIEGARRLIETFENMDDESEETSEKIQELEDEIQELEDEIEEINDNPDGDFKEEAINEKIEELVDDVRRDPEWFMNEMGLEWSNYINKDSFIEDVIDTDGYGHTIGSYDGEAEEIDVLGNTFWVIRID